LKLIRFYVLYRIYFLFVLRKSLRQYFTIIITVCLIISKLTEILILVLVLVLRMLNMTFILMSRIRQTKGLNTDVNICSTKGQVNLVKKRSIIKIKINFNLYQRSYKNC
jgi:hypothetical protein